MTRSLMIAALSLVLIEPAAARSTSSHHHVRTAKHTVAKHHDRHDAVRRYREARQPFGWWNSQSDSQSEGMRYPERFPQEFGLSSGWYSARMRNKGIVNDGEPDGTIARHAAANGVPLDLARRVVARESGGNPRAVSRGNYGLMQIRHGTARAMGYGGSAAGLLDVETNLTYAMKYLAGAYRAAGGNQDRAVSLYARGYYYEAKRQGWSPYEAGNGYGAYASAAPDEDGWRGSWSKRGWGENGWSNNWDLSDRSRIRRARRDNGRQYACNDAWGANGGRASKSGMATLPSVAARLHGGIDRLPAAAKSRH